MKKYKGYLIDLDGTMYKGKEKIKEAVTFIKRLSQAKIPYLFVTNNSTKTPEEVAQVLNGFGIPAESNHVFTTSMATARYITQEKSNPKVYAIGEKGLQEALLSAGCIFSEVDPEIVISGLDRDVTYEKLATATLAVRQGAIFISTNSDIALPTERGFLPGNGALTSVISVSTGVQPTFIGKPEPTMISQALEIIGLSKEDVLLVGDNYNTDILAGIRAGIDTLHVQTGVTSFEELKNYDIQPTYSVKSLDEWNNI
ncbi:TIGR01457 family HAD-type hydrolase [Bacillus carboniphilus]|uniref:TIGR01457 family HAD-type hydrolase n=1 Tax=Bacillus carboniphilus TaxID=86663 RepID=A0ABP3FXF6_9BACI